MEKKKLIIWGSVAGVIFIGLLSYFTYLKWLSTTAFLITLAVMLGAGAVIGVIIYIMHNAKSKDEVENKVRKIDSSTLIPWSRELIRDRFCDNLDVEEYVIFNIGKEGKQTPVAHVKGYGTVCRQMYHIFADLYDPNHTNTVKIGEISDENVLKYCEALASSPIIREKRIIRRRNSDGSVTEELQESTPEIEEEEEKEE